MALKTFDPTKTPGVGSIGHDLGKGLVDRALKGFAKAISDLADNFGGAGGSVGNPAGSSVSRWKPYVVRALKANGFGATASQVSAWMRVIARESNGNPRAINLWDSNAKKGIPSMGLVQTIRPTFEAYKFSGHGQIYNGYDDLLAGINYMKHIYGKGDSAFARVSGPEGYANGGFGNKAGVYKLFEGNLPEAIVPMDLSKRSRAYQIMQQIMAKFGAQDGANVINTGNDQIDSDEAFKQRVIASLDALVTGQGDVKAVVANSDVVNAVKSNTKKTAQYSQMMGY
jgi:SLT domain-containing protein